VVVQISCLLLRVNDYGVLFVGRLLSGVATSFLSTCYECWMVDEHNHRRFPPQLIGNTFSAYILGMGAVAVFSGIVAGFAVDHGER
jgi:MFS transporter, MFS domain-containing protein family, molybdate-anion transporter